MHQTDRPIRIAVASSGLGHVMRGIESWAADLALGLERAGADVTLYGGAAASPAGTRTTIPCWRRSDPRTLRLLRILPQHLTWRLGLSSGYGIEQTTFACGLIAHLRRTRADVLHVQDPQVASIANWARRLGWTRAVPILAHGTEESAGFLERFDRVQHLAPAHADTLRQSGVWKDTWTVIPNFVDTVRFSPGQAAAVRGELGIPDDAFVVLCAAAIKNEHKRVGWLVEEMARLRQMAPALPLWLVVAGAREAETDAVRERGLALLGDRVRFLVSYPRERMPALYRAANLFTLCSLKEMMPIALVEACATGLPSLVHDHGVHRWIVGEGGSMLNLCVDGALAGEVLRLAADHGERRVRSAAARRRAVEEFGEAAVVDRMLTYYQTIVADNRRES